MTFPNRYEGQIQRHIEEMQDMMKAARLMESAPQLLEELMGMMCREEITQHLSSEDKFRIELIIKNILQ